MSDEEETPAEGAAPEAEKKDAAEAGGEEVGGGGVPPKVDTGKRFLAFLVDGIIAGVVGGVGGTIGGIIGHMIHPIVGGILTGLAQGAGGGYLLLRDSLNDGRSVGKKVMKLTVQTPDGSPCTQEQSIKRNTIIALPSLLAAAGAFFGGIPVLGMIVALVAGIGSLVASLAYLYEAIQVLALDANGRRMMELKSQTYTVLAAE